MTKVKSAHIGFCCVYVHPCCQVGNVELSCYKVKDPPYSHCSVYQRVTITFTALTVGTQWTEFHSTSEVGAGNDVTAKLSAFPFESRTKTLESCKIVADGCQCPVSTVCVFVCETDVCLSRPYVLCRHCVINLILLLSIFLFVVAFIYLFYFIFCCCQSPQQPSTLRPTVNLFYTVCL